MPTVAPLVRILAFGGHWTAERQGGQVNVPEWTSRPIGQQEAQREPKFSIQFRLLHSG